MALMLGGALRVILLFMNYSLSFRIEGEKTGQFWIVVKGIIISLLVVVINCLMRLVVTDSLCRYKPLLTQSVTTPILSTKALSFSTTQSSISSMPAASSTLCTRKTPRKISSYCWLIFISSCSLTLFLSLCSSCSTRWCGSEPSEGAISQGSNQKKIHTRNNT